MLIYSLLLGVLLLPGLPLDIWGQDKRDNVIFLQSEYSLGTVSSKETAGRKVVAFDYFNETGKELVVRKVKTSCGCISVDYPSGPIRALEKGQLKVLLNLEGIEGSFRETLLVYMEDYSPVLLVVFGEIVDN